VAVRACSHRPPENPTASARGAPERGRGALLASVMEAAQVQQRLIERQDLAAPMFRFAAAMPALTRLTGLDEFGDDEMALSRRRGAGGPGR
jgi:hypothetical protein